MKKWGITLAAVSMVAAALLTGCSKTNEPADNQKGKNTNQPITSNAEGEETGKTIKGELTFLTWETNIVDTKLKDMADLFMKKYPDVKLKIEGFSDEQTIKIRAASDNLSDIVNLTDNHLNRDQWSKFFVPLNNLPIASQLLGLESLVAPDGNNYTAPRGLMVSPVVWYNKSIFSELGLSIPKTYSDFLEVCQAIKDSGKYYPLSSGAKDAWPLDPYQQIAALISDDMNLFNNSAKLDEPYTADSGYVKGFHILKDLLDKGYFENDPLSVGFDTATNNLGTGKAAMMIMGSWLYQNMSEKGIDMENMAIFPMPLSDTVSETTTLTVFPDLPMAINKNTKSMDAALAFLEWYFEEYDSEFMKYSGMLSSLKTADNASIPWAGFIKEFNLNLVTLAPQEEYAIKVWNNSGITPSKALQEIVTGKSIEAVSKDLNNKFKKARATVK